MHPNEVNLTKMTEEQRSALVAELSPAHQAALKEQYNRQTQK